MSRSSRTHPHSLLSWIIYLVGGIGLAAVFAMVVPVWVALSAGIASVSVVVFGAACLTLGLLYVVSNRSHRLFLAVSFCAALFGLIVPQVAFYRAAHIADVPLSFNPASYLKFSGTSQAPTRFVSYKNVDGRSLKLAYFEASNPGTRPLVVVLHGGAWRYGSHSEIGDWPRLLNAHGYDVASVEYRLASEQTHTWNQSPVDVHDALTYLTNNAETLDIDPARIHLLGQSAGGHLALLEAYRSPIIRSVVSLYAPVDLELDYETSRDKTAELDFVGGPPAQYAERYAALSPLNYVTNTSPRSLIIQGTRDDLVATANATRLAKRLREARVEHRLLLLPLTGHSFENQRGGFATQIAEQTVLDFLQ